MATTSYAEFLKALMARINNSSSLQSLWSNLSDQEKLRYQTQLYLNLSDEEKSIYLIRASRLNINIKKSPTDLSLYVRHQYSAIKISHPKISFSQIVIQLTKSWNELGEEGQKTWLNDHVSI